MLEVGHGQRSLEDFKQLFHGRPRSASGRTAPPHGLYLVAVRY
jgi:tRNA U38,U39,U40 pseudouridine synthase TruA